MEAEFTAACDAGKAILYIRSILDEINVPQDKATTLYIILIIMVHYSWGMLKNPLGEPDIWTSRSLFYSTGYRGILSFSSASTHPIVE